MQDRLSLQLLPPGPYSAVDPVLSHTQGIALERQRGVHAIGSDRRRDFDTWPGVLAYTPAGVQVFSESQQGGEYLVARWSDALTQAEPVPAAQRRLESAGHAQALSLGRQLRRMVLDPNRDLGALEELALRFIGLQTASRGAAPEPLRSPGYARVLDRIRTEFDRPLSLSDLAAAQNKTALRFLREFRQAVGMTPHAFLVETRVQAARRLLAHTDLPLSAVAFDCGFAHQSHMGTAFRSVLAMTPMAYRRAFSARG
ncbi:MAG TPA: AraC family transcriptional regulator [Pseudorhodoferax sp.]|nr:AraC family transcriptional regulator [Pseudorhodoferax sp.]